jgi:hypothetical protein
MLECYCLKERPERELQLRKAEESLEKYYSPLQALEALKSKIHSEPKKINICTRNGIWRARTWHQYKNPEFVTDIEREPREADLRDTLEEIVRRIANGNRSVPRRVSLYPFVTQTANSIEEQRIAKLVRRRKRCKIDHGCVRCVPRTEFVDEFTDNEKERLASEKDQEIFDISSLLPKKYLEEVLVIEIIEEILQTQLLNNRSLFSDDDNKGVRLQKIMNISGCDQIIAERVYQALVEIYNHLTLVDSEPRPSPPKHSSAPEY